MVKNTTARHGEHGVALVITMLSLMLLSVIALGMLVSTNTETSITSNFRDKQAATYAAIAGLQEARDRIQPVTHSITAPTDVPSLSAANVIYVINPKSGETVAPWDMTNPYKDTELCHAAVLGLTNSGAGVPCSSSTTGMVVTSNSSWRSVVNDSLSSSAPWNLATPLDVKWIRITLKTNNMTPIAVDGNSSSGRQVCYDGYHQVSLPSGYGSDCAPDGGIACLGTPSPCTFAAGHGYSSVPTVTLSAPPAGGIQATATAGSATTPNGVVQGATVLAGGSSYTSAPTVTLSGGGGSGATATATIQAPGAPVASVSLTSAGSQCYSVAPAVSFSGGAGSGAAATSVLVGTKSCIQGWTVSGSVNGVCNSLKNTSNNVVNVSGGGGSGFSGLISFKNNGTINGSPSIQNPGTGYTSAPTAINMPALGACGLTLTANVGYAVQSVTLANGGSSYTSAPTMSIGTGTGTGAAPTATATLGSQPGNAGQVTAINITSGGSGYTIAPTVTFSGGGGSGASGSASLGSTLTITCCTITNPGKGYTSDPTVTFSGGSPTTAATATATLGRGIHYGSVYVLTSLAKTANGSRTMMQMEASTPVIGGWAPTGALTLDGPLPVASAPGFPNSNNYVIHGADNNSCGETPEVVHPAIAAYDDPNNPLPQTSVQTIASAIPRANHYTGTGNIPDVIDSFSNFGDTLGTPTGLKALTDSVHAVATSYTSNPGSFNLGSSSSPQISYVDGDLSLSGNTTGYGVLVVTGSLHMGGNFSWNGVILVVGDGILDANGGGNGQILGTVLVAKIWDNNTNKNLLASNGVPSFNWNGGGGNGILYDHCWATNLMNHIPFTPPPTTQALKILSIRQLPY
jgi:Tfp pilus assembly protein PilX